MIERCCKESKLVATIVFSLFLVSGMAIANDQAGHERHGEMMRKSDATAADFVDIELPDADLIDQDGLKANLADEIVGDRLVVVDFVYTTCTTICPVLSATFRQVQSKLGDRLGGEVVMISLSVDPGRDTPPRLKNYAEKLGARDGWVWLTGDRRTITEVLREFGAYTPNFTDHPSMVLVGDGKSGKWIRFVGFPSATQIVNKVDEFSLARATREVQDATRETVR